MFVEFAELVKDFEKDLGNMRKARGGKTFEKTLLKLLRFINIPCEIPSGKERETLRRIDLVIPYVKGEKTQFKNINYWFNNEAINVLSKIKQVILRIERNDIRDFFLVAFAETVRMVSNAKYNEFKLLRKKEVNPLNTAQVFSKISLKNMELLCNFYQKNLPQKVLIKLEMLDITDGIPISDETIDLVITSPPYGDSRTTVAYGQFSRLPLQWLGWDCNVDNLSLGAKPAMVRAGLPSKILYEVALM